MAAQGEAFCGGKWRWQWFGSGVHFGWKVAARFVHLQPRFFCLEQSGNASTTSLRSSLGMK